MPQVYSDRNTQNHDSGWAGESAAAQTLSTGQSGWNGWSSQAQNVSMEGRYNSGNSSVSSGHSHQSQHQEQQQKQQQSQAQYVQDSRTAQTELYESQLQQHRDQQQQPQQWSEQAAQNQWNAMYRDQQPQYVRQHSYQGSSPSYNVYQGQSHTPTQQSLSSQLHQMHHHQVHNAHNQASSQQQQQQWSGDNSGQVRNWPWCFALARLALLRMIGNHGVRAVFVRCGKLTPSPLIVSP
jgi:hypothetical protein